MDWDKTEARAQLNLDTIDNLEHRVFVDVLFGRNDKGAANLLSSFTKLPETCVLPSDDEDRHRDSTLR